MKSSVRSLSRCFAGSRRKRNRGRDSLCPLTHYAQDGLEIDNNAAERALRAVALRPKNFLFAGSDCGGERSAATYTLLGSAKLNGLDPELYLRTVMAQNVVVPADIVEVSGSMAWGKLIRNLDSGRGTR
jgi:hypothetical protein